MKMVFIGRSASSQSKGMCASKTAFCHSSCSVLPDLLCVVCALFVFGNESKDEVDDDDNGLKQRKKEETVVSSL